MQRPTGTTALMGGTIFLIGFAFGASGPYRAVVGVETLGLSNTAFAVVMGLSALGTALASVALGWLSDRVEDRRTLMTLCAVMGVFGFGLVWALPTQASFVVAICGLVPFGTALLSQSLSFSRAYLTRIAPARAEVSMAALRSNFAAAWVIVPPLGGWVAAQGDPVLTFLMSALAYVGAVILIGLLWRRPDARQGVKSPGAPDLSAPLRLAPDKRLGFAGLVLAQSALTLNMTVVPLVILRDLGGSLPVVGIAAAVSAGLEIPLMIFWGHMAARHRREPLLALGCAAMALYMALLAMAGGVGQAIATMMVAAIGVSAYLTLSVSYLQTALTGRVGLSTSLVDVAHVIAALVAALIFGANTGTTYQPLMWACAAMALAGAALVHAAGRRAARLPIDPGPETA